MKSFGNVLFALIALVLSALLIYFIYIFNHGELADASPASTLQKIEYSHRNQDLGSVIVLDSAEGDKVVGLKTSVSAFPYAWLYLNRLSSDHDVMVIPSEPHIAVPCQTVMNTLKDETVNAAVTAFLKQKCNP